MSSRSELLEQLQAERGNPVVLVGASWRQDIATDLDAGAARAFVRVVESLGRPDALTVVLVARGGQVAFADAVARSLRSAGVTFELAIPTLVTGAGALLALAADEVLIHPHGGIGAFDAGPLNIDDGKLSHHLVDDVPALGGIAYERTDPNLPARLAAGMRERRLARALAERLTGDTVDLSELSELRLGHDVGLDAGQLAEIGVDASIFDSDELWQLFLTVEQDLGILKTALPAYTESDLGDEVEFEPAMGIVSAVVESTENSLTYELDTGRPDPDTGRYTGGWKW